jgi:hypothetical protein
VNICEEREGEGVVNKEGEVITYRRWVFSYSLHLSSPLFTHFSYYEKSIYIYIYIYIGRLRLHIIGGGEVKG